MTSRSFDQEPPPNRAERRALERLLKSSKKKIKRQHFYDPKNPPRQKP